MSDIKDRLKSKADSISLGERIAWGSDTALMLEAAQRIEEIESGIAMLWGYSAEYAEDGYMELEWGNSPQDVFSFAINESGEVSFSGILGGKSFYGSGEAKNCFGEWVMTHTFGPVGPDLERIGVRDE